jgi:hypothetical protein
MSQNRELAAKESATFKSVLKFYELRQYKKGLKSCEQILKKYPEHGGMLSVFDVRCTILIHLIIETLAMKGLFCSHLDRKDEAHEFIKKGIRQDITSHICNFALILYTMDIL